MNVNLRSAFQFHLDTLGLGHIHRAATALALAREGAAKGMHCYYSRPTYAAGGKPSDKLRYYPTYRDAGFRFVCWASRAVSRSIAEGHYVDGDCHGMIRGAVFQLSGRSGFTRLYAGYVETAGPDEGEATIETREYERLDNRHECPDISDYADTAFHADRLAQDEAESRYQYNEDWQRGVRVAELDEDRKELRNQLLAVSRQLIAGVEDQGVADALTKLKRKLLGEVVAMIDEAEELKRMTSNKEAFDNGYGCGP